MGLSPTFTDNIKGLRMSVCNPLFLGSSLSMEAARPHFDIFITLDQNLQFQNRAGTVPLWGSSFFAPVAALTPDSCALTRR